MFDYFGSSFKDPLLDDLCMCLPVSVELCKNLCNCIINSGLEVLVFWAFSFNEETGNMFIEALKTSGKVKIISFRYGSHSYNFYELLGEVKSLKIINFSCSEKNKSENIMQALHIKQQNPDIVIGLTEIGDGDDIKYDEFHLD